MSENPIAISIATFGVQDLEASRDFYNALGFIDTAQSNKDIKFMRGANIVLGLYGRAALAKDAEIADDTANIGKFSGVTFALNRTSEADVDALFAKAVAAGATAKKPPQKVFWGGYSGYFADPNGHLWEVAYNPYFAVDVAGVIDLEAKPPKEFPSDPPADK